MADKRLKKVCPARVPKPAYRARQKAVKVVPKPVPKPDKKAVLVRQQRQVLREAGRRRPPLLPVRNAVPKLLMVRLPKQRRPLLLSQRRRVVGVLARQ